MRCTDLTSDAVVCSSYSVVVVVAAAAVYIGWAKSHATIDFPRSIARV